MNNGESRAAAAEPPTDLPGTADETLLALRDGFEPVPLRARHDGCTPARQRAFIEALAESFCIADAAAAVGMSTRGAYEGAAAPAARDRFLGFVPRGRAKDRRSRLKER